MKHEQKKADVAADKDQTSVIPPSNQEADLSGLSDSTVAGNNPAATADSQGQPDAQKGEKDELAQLKDRIVVLEKQNADLQDQYLRKAADFDNYRKRMIREKQEAVDFANTNLLVDLVQVLDDFDRAIDAGGQHEPGSTAAAFADGVQMIRGQFSTMLETKYELTYYPAKGQVFDPNIHEAIGTAVSAEITEPVVSEEFVKGYKLKDRVIRLAKVMVTMPAGEGAEQPQA